MARSICIYFFDKDRFNVGIKWKFSRFRYWSYCERNIHTFHFFMFKFWPIILSLAVKWPTSFWRCMTDFSNHLVSLNLHLSWNAYRSASIHTFSFFHHQFYSDICNDGRNYLPLLQFHCNKVLVKQNKQKNTTRKTWLVVFKHQNSIILVQALLFWFVSASIFC